MSYYPMTFLNEELKSEYIFYFRDTVNLMNRPRVSAYSRHYLYGIFKDLDHELISFIQLHNKKLPSDQQKFMRGLLNLTKNMKRYINNTKATSFPVGIAEQTTQGLQQFLKDYVKAHNFKMDQDIILLTTDQHLELAEKLWPNAQKMLSE